MHNVMEKLSTLRTPDIAPFTEEDDNYPNPVIDLPKSQRFKLPPKVKDYLYEMPVNFGFGMLGAVTYYRCVAVGTKILTSDLRWVNAETLVEGDELLGVDEEPQGTTRRFKTSVVEDASIRQDECFEVVTDRGTVVVSTEHPFLVSTSNKRRWDWIKVEDLIEGSLVRFVAEPWESEDGNSWLAGFADGEGSLSGPRVSLTQLSGRPITDRLINEMSDRNFSFVVYEESSQHRKPITVISSQNVASSMRFLGQLRPQRLLEVWRERLNDSKIGLPRDGAARVLSVKPVGVRDIVNLQTSSRTFISEGFVSHNTYSRQKPDGSQEQWADTVIRVVEGVFTIRKWWYLKNNIEWNDTKWTEKAIEMAYAVHRMEMLPPGRGLA